MATDIASENALAQGRNFVWHEIYAPDIQKTVEFYTQALNFGSTTMPMGDMGDYTMLTRDGKPIAGVVSSNMSEGIPPHWATYLGVDDVDASVERSVELGATLVVPAMDVPTVGRMALIHDPQGAHIWLFKGDPSQS
jgi:predicted enzyme related to lactoylglutathione lyase